MIWRLIKLLYFAKTCLIAIVLAEYAFTQFAWTKAILKALRLDETPLIASLFVHQPPALINPVPA